MNILYTEIIKETHFIWSWNVFWTIFIVILFLILSCVICFFLDEKFDIPYIERIWFVLLMLIIIIGSYKIVMSACEGNDTFSKQYYVTIDENTTWNSINDKYIVIEQKGDLFILTDKEE